MDERIRFVSGALTAGYTGGEGNGLASDEVRLQLVDYWISLGFGALTESHTEREGDGHSLDDVGLYISTYTQGKETGQ